MELTIDFADVYRYVEQIEQLTRKVDSILPTIYHSGKVYEQEAIFIKQTLNHINDVGNDVWRYVVAMRSEMFDSVHKYLYKTICKYSYTKQQNKKRMNELEKKHKDLISK